MIEEDQDGLMTVDQDLWGQERGSKFLNRNAAASKTRSAVTQAKQAGSNDYFDSEGNFLGSGKSGSEIRIVKKGQENNTKNFHKNSLPFSKRPLRESAVGKIGGYYLKLLGFDNLPIRGLLDQSGANPFAAVISENGEATKKTQEGLIFTNPSISIGMIEAFGFEGFGRVNNTFNNKNNFMNTLYHESLHQISMHYLGGSKYLGGFADGNDLGRANHLNIYWMQINHPSFSKSTPGYQNQTINFAKTLYYDKIRNSELKAYYKNLFNF